MSARTPKFVSNSLRGNLARLAVAGLLAAGAYQAFKVNKAWASTRRTICAQDLYVRDAPAGIFIGTLYYGQSIEVTKYSPSGDWAYGFAYGNVNKWGWVQNGWFCN